MSSEIIRRYITLLETTTPTSHPIKPADVWAMMGINEAQPTDVWAAHDKQKSYTGHMLRDVADRLVNDIDNNIASRSENVEITVDRGENVDTLTVRINGGYVRMLIDSNVHEDNPAKILLMILNLYRAQGWKAIWDRKDLVLSGYRKH